MDTTMGLGFRGWDLGALSYRIIQGYIGLLGCRRFSTKLPFRTLATVDGENPAPPRIW